MTVMHLDDNAYKCFIHAYKRKQRKQNDMLEFCYTVSLHR